MKTTNSIIKMGNDEFILYIRKTSSTCSITNDDLGKYIWIWLRDRGADKIKEDVPCLWGKTAQNLDALKLPKTAAQFEFNRNLLTELYDYLDELATK